jgi:hypothetical protein
MTSWPSSARQEVNPLTPTSGIHIRRRAEMARDNMNDVEQACSFRLFTPPRHKNVILMVVNGGKMRTKVNKVRRKGFVLFHRNLLISF